MLKLYSFLKVCLLKWCASSTFPPFPCLAKRELTKVDTASPQCNLSIYSHKKNTIKSLIFFFFLKYQVLPRTSNIAFRNINCRLTSHYNQRKSTIQRFQLHPHVKKKNRHCKGTREIYKPNQLTPPHWSFMQQEKQV